LARSLNFRLITALVLGIAPAAVLLVILGAGETLSFAIVGVVLGLGVLGGGLAALGLALSFGRRAERIEAVAGALQSREPPAHLLPDDRDALGRAEHRLLDAADGLITEVGLLAEQRDEFEAILRGMTEAVVVTNHRGEVVLLNGAARRMFELAADADYRGRDFVELCRDPRLQEFVARSMGSAGGQVIGGEIQIQFPAPRHLSANAAPVHRMPGGAATWVLVFHDITQLKAYETQRADFVANLTHELRTPISALCGYAETLLEGVEDADTTRRFLAIIERQSRRLSRLIDDLISLSDLERGLTPLKPEPLEPRRVLEEAAELMGEQAHQRGVAIEVKCAPDAPPAMADHDRMHQVMLNLIDNALKYTPRDGHVRLEARSAPATADEERPGVEFIVADTGEGIPAADIPRLTERFYRVDRARSRELGGTGLGLAIIKHIVQLHHGLLKIESKLREGTTVTVWIPAAPA
jgi:two-component system, OmpR family, phosphate regulon sensor histidine kinase PhoR